MVKVNPSTRIRAYEYGVPLRYPMLRQDASQLAQLLMWAQQVCHRTTRQMQRLLGISSSGYYRMLNTGCASPAQLYAVSAWIHKELGYRVSTLDQDRLAQLGAAEKPAKWRTIAQNIRQHLVGEEEVDVDETAD